MITRIVASMTPRPIKTSIGKALRWRRRFNLAASYYKPTLGSIFSWLKHSKEITNFTYDLTDSNRVYLANMIAVVVGETPERISAYITELDTDQALRDHITKATEASAFRHISDPVQYYAKRLGWYAFVRATKPKVVVETGIDKGLGSCVLAAALAKNAQEGHMGTYYGTDIDPGAGYLFTAPYNQYGKVLYGDSIESLKALNQTIDLFINDSDHSAEYEAREYETIEHMLSPNAIILGDNSHATDKLCSFAMRTGRHFLFFGEVPKDHWYPGGGIGIAYTKRA